jgi:hypothetical protein
MPNNLLTPVDRIPRTNQSLTFDNQPGTSASFSVPPLNIASLAPSLAGLPMASSKKVPVPRGSSWQFSAVATEKLKAIVDSKKAAKARLNVAKKAAKKLHYEVTYGVSTKHQLQALQRKFVTQDGKPDTVAFSRHEREQGAIRYTDAEGNHPFANPGGKPDVKGHGRLIASMRDENFEKRLLAHPRKYTILRYDPANPPADHSSEDE